MRHCPICGDTVLPGHEVIVEEERYVGAMECEMKLSIWFCGQQKQCNRVTAANRLDEVGNHFLDVVGRS